jgi:hypothetical protein
MELNMCLDFTGFGVSDFAYTLAMEKHSPDRKYPPGLEWSLFCKIPLLTLTGFVVIGALALLARFWPWEGDPKGVLDLIQRLDFALIGAGIFHLSVMLTLAIGCVVVLIMKGPRYSADSYPVSDSDRPKP